MTSDLLKDVPLPPGSASRIVKARALRRFFRDIADVTIDATDADVSEGPNGLSLLPRVNFAGTPGLTLVPHDSPAGWTVVPCRIGGVMPGINGQLLDADPAPVLLYKGPGLIVICIDVTATNADMSPLATADNARIGYLADFPGIARPQIAWASAITDDPPQLDATTHTITDGQWIIPLARVPQTGPVIPLLTCDYSSSMDIALDYETRHW